MNPKVERQREKQVRKCISITSRLPESDRCLWRQSCLGSKNCVSEFSDVICLSDDIRIPPRLTGNSPRGILNVTLLKKLTIVSKATIVTNLYVGILFASLTVQFYYYCRVHKHNTLCHPLQRNGNRVLIHYMFRLHRPSLDVFTHALF
jgi:hypothetical protein